jgi:hypothetical protein
LSQSLIGVLPAILALLRIEIFTSGAKNCLKSFTTMASERVDASSVLEATSPSSSNKASICSSSLGQYNHAKKPSTTNSMVLTKTIPLLILFLYLNDLFPSKLIRMKLLILFFLPTLFLLCLFSDANAASPDLVETENSISFHTFDGRPIFSYLTKPSREAVKHEAQFFAN